MSEDKLLQQIESVLRRARFYLYRVHSNDLELIQAIRSITHDLQALQSVITPPKEPEMYALTIPHFGSTAYLAEQDDTYVVVVEDEEVTHTSTSAVSVLKKYCEYCHNNDFIDDFLYGVEQGSCSYGVNKYADYVKELFKIYIMEKEIDSEQ